MELNNYLTEGKSALKQVSSIFNKNFGQAINVRHKDDDRGNIVTDIDLLIEKTVVEYLHSKFPTHQFIGEEFTSEDKSKTEFVWYIDPIDGTTNYVRGLPECCISLALWQSGQPLVALVFDPIRNVLYSAVTGNGSFRNDSKVKASDIQKLSDSIGAIGWRNKDQGLRLIQKIMPSSKKVRVFGSIALQLCYVGDGSLDYVAATSAKVWDVAAGILIVKEAGAKLTNWNNDLFGDQSDNLISANPTLHEEILGLLKE